VHRGAVSGSSRMSSSPSPGWMSPEPVRASRISAPLLLPQVRKKQHPSMPHCGKRRIALRCAGGQSAARPPPSPCRYPNRPGNPADPRRHHRRDRPAPGPPHLRRDRQHPPPPRPSQRRRTALQPHHGSARHPHLPATQPPLAAAGSWPDPHHPDGPAARRVHQHRQDLGCASISWVSKIV